MSKRSLIAIATSLCLSFSFSANAQNYKIVFANYFGADHPNTMMMEKFKTEIESNSKGKFKVVIKSNNEAGGESQIMELVKQGKIEMAQVGGLIKEDEPMIAALEQPFIIDDWEHARKVFLSDGIEKFKGAYKEKSGARIGGIIVNGFREISSSFPVTSMQDLAKMKMRTPLNDVFVELFKSLGTTPIPLPAKELYTALETKKVDGQDNPYAMFDSMGWYEQNRYVLESRHIFSPTFILINDKWYNSIANEDKKIFDEALREAIDYNWEISEDGELDIIEILKDKGVTINIPSDEFKAQMKEAVKPVYNWFDKDVKGAKEFREYCEGLR